MCQRVTCKSCGKPTYAGCGRHIEAVLGDVPPDARCRCREAAGKEAPTSIKRAGMLSSLLGFGWRRT
jgi:hypothetical protein